MVFGSGNRLLDKQLATQGKARACVSSGLLACAVIVQVRRASSADICMRWLAQCLSKHCRATESRMFLIGRYSLVSALVPLHWPLRISRGAMFFMRALHWML